MPALLLIADRTFYTWDIIALLWLVASWVGYASFARYNSHSHASIIGVMNLYRNEWMKQMLQRENRMVDATILGNLLRSIAFFASTSVFIIAGLLSLLNHRDAAESLLSAVPLASESNHHSWELRILILTIIFVYAFFKYTWSLRQYNYACIVVGAAPGPKAPKAQLDRHARKTSMLISNAGHHFNFGLRAYYFGLATLSWFVHPVLFMLASTFVVLVLYRREFRSQALEMLLDSHKEEETES